MPLAAVVAAGTVAVADVALVMLAGPDHAYPVTFAAPLADSINVPPVHTGPLLEALVSDGKIATFTTAVSLQPVGSVYVIIEEPAVTGVTTPDPETIVATAVLPLVQDPPLVASDNVIVDPVHSAPAPVIAAGVGFTVTFATEKHPLLTV